MLNISEVARLNIRARNVQVTPGVEGGAPTLVTWEHLPSRGKMGDPDYEAPYFTDGRDDTDGLTLPDDGWTPVDFHIGISAEEYMRKYIENYRALEEIRQDVRTLISLPKKRDRGSLVVKVSQKLDKIQANLI
jgi:hypothetical protein